VTASKAEEPRHHHDKETDRKILEFVAENPGSDRAAIAKAFTKGTSSVNEHVRHLVSEGDLQDGLFLTDAGKRKQIKVYICIYTECRPLRSMRKAGENYQQALVDEIKATLATDEYVGKLYIDGIDIIMGGDFDVILTLRANRLEPIGSLVTGFLRSHRFIYKTRTLMAWPTTSIP
jgi:DNA-binding Lrp family transcriptional regulator